MNKKNYNFIYKRGFDEYYITNFYKYWDGFHNYYDPCFYDLLVCVIDFNDPYEFLNFINYQQNKIQKIFDNLICTLEEKEKLLRDIKIQANFEVEKILNEIKLNNTNNHNENIKKQSVLFSS